MPASRILTAICEVSLAAVVSRTTGQKPVRGVAKPFSGPEGAGGGGLITPRCPVPYPP